MKSQDMNYESAQNSFEPECAAEIKRLEQPFKEMKENWLLGNMKQLRITKVHKVCSYLMLLKLNA